MKRLCLFLLMPLALAAAACGTIPATSTGVPPPIVSTQGTLADERVLFTAEAGYNATSTAYLAAVRQNLLPAPVKARAKAALLTAYQALRVARAAQRSGEADTFTAQIAEATAAVTLARGLLPGGGA